MTEMTVKKARPEKSICVRLVLERKTMNTGVYRETISAGGAPALFTKPLYIPKERLQQQFGEVPGQLDLLVTLPEGAIRPGMVPDLLVQEGETANFGVYGAFEGQFFRGKGYLPKIALRPFGELPVRLRLALSLPGGK